MRVLIGCERSGVVREAFRKRGHDAWSCDLAPAEDNSPFHIQGDLLWFVENIEPFDLFIVHPPCQYLSSSGLHWNHRRPERQALTDAGADFATRCWSAPDNDAPMFPKTKLRICLENPIGRLSRVLGKPTQIIQPNKFGENASKATCLWLRWLPALVPTKTIPPRIVNGKKRWANQTDSGQNRLAPSAHRAMDRARTYQGIADAMAEQWGNLT